MSTTPPDDRSQTTQEGRAQGQGAPRETALLVGVRWPSTAPPVVEEHLDELGLLAQTAGADVVGRIIQRRDRPDAATYIGKGKAKSLVMQGQELGCDLIIFDEDLSPSQHKNLQKMAGEDIKVIDRSGLILDIFGKRARSREAKTQVELAQLQYMLPRLSGLWTHLERQKGGIGTRGGPGETQIEVDRRMTRARIRLLQNDLKHIVSERATQSHRRQQAFRVALVGYTNAGKSTLLNALTGAQVYVEDRLFATLDTTTRKLALSDGHTVLLSDTVGFIRKLPHHLIASFRSTLTEVAEADLILKILDASSPQVMEHFEAINEVLGELGLSDRPSRVVLNKLDAIDDDGSLAQLQRQFPDAVVVSARQRLRLDRLEAAISQAYSQDFDQVQLRVPPEQSRLISAVYEALEVKDRTFDQDTTVLTVRGPRAVIQSFQSKLEGRV
ncbi:MAG: GTPase HflX [Candidatus Marinimicrobia bacterium]|nr:GTPase HflX [Candidatus Neomarinimicrobiota bacterium]